MSEMISTIANIINQLHKQDTETLKLITRLIQSVSRIEDRVTVLEHRHEMEDHLKAENQN